MKTDGNVFTKDDNSGVLNHHKNRFLSVYTVTRKSLKWMMVWVRLTKEKKMGKKKMNIEKLAFFILKS